MINKFATASPLLGGRSLPSINAGLKDKVTPHMGKFTTLPSMETIGAAAGMISGASSMYDGIMNNLNAPDVELMNMQAQNKNDLLSRGNQFAQQGGYANQLGETNVAGSTLSMAGTGAAAGMALGPVGAIVGGGIGAIGGLVSSVFGNSKRRRKEREAFLKTQRQFAGTNNLINTNEISQWQGNQLAYGGILPMTQQVSNILQSRGNNIFAHGGQFDNGVNNFGTGGTHEESPYGGIPVGMGENGEPNLVEEGEVKWNDYIFSDRLKIDSVKDMYLPENIKGKTFAEAALDLSKESEERPYNSISRRGLEDSLGKLAIMQEQMKEIQEQADSEAQGNVFATGGNLFAGGGGLGVSPVTSGGNIEQGIEQELSDAYIRAGIDNPDMIRYLIAQDRLESRYTPQGQHNYSNITAGKGYKGKTTKGNDHDGKGKKITQDFREYDSVDDFVKDKIALLKRRYDFDANDTAEVFASKLDGNNKSKYRWAEDPKYGEKMINVFGGDFSKAPADYRKAYASRQTDDNTTSTTIASEKDKGREIKDIDGTFASDNNTMYAGIANNVSANAYNPVAVPPIQEREQSQVDTNSGGNDYLRYAPVISQLGSLAGLYGESADTLNLGRMSATHLQDRMQYNPMDSEYITNQIRQHGANTNNAIMDSSGGNRGVAQAGLLASNRSTGDAIGDSMFRMAEYNNQNRQQVQDFNRGTNRFNAQQDMQVSKANLNMQAQEQMYNKQAQAALSNAKRQAFAGIGTTLGQIGTENRFMRIAPTISGGYDSEGNYIGYKKALGGPLNKFYKKKIK